MYNPKPIDTTEVILSEDINKLVEKLAENAHEIWSQQRLKDGWAFGEKRDDEFKKHPCLVPYNELPEAEKEYDRKMAIETLKTMIKFGYSVEKK
jgi:hypothetical protein